MKHNITPALTKYNGCLIRLQSSGKFNALSREYNSIEEAKQGIDSALVGLGQLLRRDNPHCIAK